MSEKLSQRSVVVALNACLTVRLEVNMQQYTVALGTMRWAVRAHLGLAFGAELSCSKDHFDTALVRSWSYM